jgi:hypothetical protein
MPPSHIGGLGSQDLAWKIGLLTLEHDC